MPAFKSKDYEGFFWEYLAASRGSNSLILFFKGVPVAHFKYRGKKIPVLCEKYLIEWMERNEVLKLIAESNPTCEITPE